MAPVPPEEYCTRMCQDLRTGGYWRDAFSELFATFFLVAVQLFLLQRVGGDDPNPIVVALGMALVVGSVGYALGDFGGAHMNPAVTFAFMIRSEISIFKAILYWMMQAGAGLCAALFVGVFLDEEQLPMLGATRLNDDFEWWQGVVMEAFLTMILCLTALGTCNIPRKGYIILPSLPVGLALGLGLFLGLPITGGSLNPARSLGPELAMFIADPEAGFYAEHWVYWAGPMGGALLAAIIYWIFDSVDPPPVPIYDNTNTWNYQAQGKAQPKEVVNVVYPSLN